MSSSASSAGAYPPLGVLPLARMSPDRVCERRGEAGFIDNLWGKPSTKVMLISAGRTPVRNGALALAESQDRDVPPLPIYLGRIPEEDGSGALDIVADVLPASAADLAPATGAGDQWSGLRDVAMSLSARDAGLFVEAAAVSNWHATHTHCPRCGHPTLPERGGWVRRCPMDNSEHFPRTDPAVIVTVVDDQDRLLLGSSGSWAANRFSTLAGFVEPGESLEAAVIREVREESGVDVHSPQYLGSQPWPFPCSLMLGFTARASSTHLTPDGVEIVAVRWFARQELADALAAGEIEIAGGVSIARALIEHWYGGPLQDRPLQDRPTAGAG